MAVGSRSDAARYLGGVLLLAASYYGAAKLGQTLQYTASVSAIWPPAGLGIAVLYLWGPRLWPGIFLGELLVNAELLSGHNSLPLGSLIGQQTGNIAEIVVGAVVLRQLIGTHARLDRVDQVGRLLLALASATAISATVGTVSMLAGGVIAGADAPTFWRTWWLGDTAGALVVVPLIVTWARDPAGALRRVWTWEGAVLMASVAALAVVGLSADEPVTYMVFPALIWAALRFGPPGAALAVAIAAGVVIGVTANDLGPFFKQQIDHQTLSTQAYIAVAALTAMFLSAVVSERERSAAQLVEARRHEGEQAARERHRIARDLHDSVSQSLFSSALHTRRAQRVLEGDGGAVGRDLSAIAALTKDAQGEIRGIVAELGGGPADKGLADALRSHASTLAAREGLDIDVRAPEERLPLSRLTEAQLFVIAREALANVAKHADTRRGRVIVERRADRVLVEIRDHGRGFDPGASYPDHFGIGSMRSRADEIGGRLTITSTPGQGVVVRVEVPAEARRDTDGV